MEKKYTIAIQFKDVITRKNSWEIRCEAAPSIKFMHKHGWKVIIFDEKVNSYKEKIVDILKRKDIPYDELLDLPTKSHALIIDGVHPMENDLAIKYADPRGCKVYEFKHSDWKRIDGHIYRLYNFLEDLSGSVYLRNKN